MNIKQLSLFFLVSIAVLFAACDENMDFGEAYIYMPQATSNGGINSLYNVPSFGGELSYNFFAENRRINIILGIIISGHLPTDNFSVKINVLNEETNNLIESGTIKNAIILPEALYVLPPLVTVDRSNQATFYLSLDSTAVMDNPAYSGRNLIQTIGISAPTSYELASKNTFTSVVIDVDKLRAILKTQ